MRTGAIFARAVHSVEVDGAVRDGALRWGVGSASARPPRKSNWSTTFGTGGIKIALGATTVVGEGKEREVEVSIRATVDGTDDDDPSDDGDPPTKTPDSGTPTRINVTLHISRTGAAGGGTFAGEDEDLDIDGVSAVEGNTDIEGALTFTFDANTDERDRTQTLTETFVIDANEDDDAENERYTLTIDAQAAGLTEDPDAISKVVIVDDDETQEYAFDLARRADPMEGADGYFEVSLEADPEPEDATRNLTLKAISTQRTRTSRPRPRPRGTRSVQAPSR